MASMECEMSDSNPSTSAILPGYDDVAVFCQEALRKTLVATKHANDISSNEDFEYYSTFKGFGDIMKSESKKILNLMTKILEHQQIKVNLKNLDTEEKFEKLTDGNDIILERIGMAIDEAAGKNKKQSEMLSLISINSRDLISTSWNKRNINKSPGNCNNVSLLAARNIVRPQLKFKEKVDNTNDPFIPKIKEKPNSIRPLSIILEPTEAGIFYSHPYQCELDHFVPEESFLQESVLKNPSTIEETPLTFVDTVEKVNSLLHDLQQVTELAIDLEHHSYRSFQGITCLMQISTRNADYIVDTLELRDDLQCLNEVFTNPKILKVMHGANMDIDWLQRDLGLYIVNMFDTGQAARVLNLGQYSLAFLLKHYFKHEVDKQFQLADWRIRPLPDVMTLYAREDTHYLLHVYDRMKNEMLERGNDQSNLLLAVFQRSKDICAKRYEKPIFHENAYLELMKKSRKVFNSRQIAAFKQLYRWRDHVARVEDESIGYVFPNHMLIKLVEVLPREQQGIIACCNGIAPPLVRQNVNELHNIIWKARENSVTPTSTTELQIQIAHTEQAVDLDDPLHCVHDVMEVDEMLDKELQALSMKIKLCAKEIPTISILGMTDKQSPQTVNKLGQVQQKILQYFKSPYRQYNEVQASAEEGSMEEPANSDMQITSDSASLVTSPTKGTKRMHGEVEEEEEMADNAIIRDQLQSDKGKKKNKKMTPVVKTNQPPDEPFDYSNVNYKEFCAGKQAGHKRNQIFDAGDHSGKGFRHPKKRKQTGGRSMSYGKRGK